MREARSDASQLPLRVELVIGVLTSEWELTDAELLIGVLVYERKLTDAEIFARSSAAARIRAQRTH
jgi:hypothetical protein